MQPLRQKETARTTMDPLADAAGPDPARSTCPLCLSSERRMFSVQDCHREYRFVTNCHELPQETWICWECRAVLLKLSRFKVQALKAKRILEIQNLIETSVPIFRKSLSNLSLTKKVSHNAHFVFQDNVIDSKETVTKIAISDFECKPVTKVDKVCVNPADQPESFVKGCVPFLEVKNERDIGLDCEISDVAVTVDLTNNELDCKLEADLPESSDIETAIYGANKESNCKIFSEQQESSDSAIDPLGKIEDEGSDELASEICSDKPESSNIQHNLNCVIWDNRSESADIGITPDTDNVIIKAIHTVMPEQGINDQFKKMNKQIVKEIEDLFETFIATAADVSNYRQRLLTRMQKCKFKCTLCVAKFKTGNQLHDHNTIYHSETIGAHECDICSTRFADVERLHVHRDRHFTMFRCKFAGCGYTGVSRSYLRAHCSRHLQQGNRSDVKHQCDICQKQFKSAYYLSLHRPSHTKRTYECHHCGKIFRMRDQIYAHVQTHSVQVICDVCGRQFANLKRLKVHYYAHLGPEHRRFQCQYCQKRFMDKFKLDIHVRIHTGERPFKCCSCIKECVSKAELTNRGEKPFQCRLCSSRNRSDVKHQCDICQKQFKSAYYLSLHRPSHTKRTYECHHCGKIFRMRDQIYAHVQTHSVQVICDVCGRQFANLKRLKVHYYAHLGPEHRRFQCQYCQKRFMDKFKLDIHVRIHTGERPFKCCSCIKECVSKAELTNHVKKHHSDIGAKKKKTSDFKPRTESLFRNKQIFPNIREMRPVGMRPVKCDECDRTFKYKSELYVHKWRHRGEKPFQCRLCSSRFAFKSILINHLKSHSKEKLFKCDECDLTFKYQAGLWTHKLIHKGEKRHQCTICGARFTQKGNLTSHMKTHNKDKPFECDLCGRKFPWKRNLRNHFKTHAKEQCADKTRLMI